MPIIMGMGLSAGTHALDGTTLTPTTPVAPSDGVIIGGGGSDFTPIIENGDPLASTTLTPIWINPNPEGSSSPSTSGGGITTPTTQPTGSPQEALASILTGLHNILTTLTVTAGGASGGGATAGVGAATNAADGVGRLRDAASSSTASRPKPSTVAEITGDTSKDSSALAKARRIYMTQYGSSTNKGAPSGTVDCGPVSTLMALRFAGIDLKGHAGEKDFSAVKAMRKLATGSTTMRNTNMDEMRNGVKKAGGKLEHVNSKAAILAASKRGEAIILGGDGFPAWNERIGRGSVDNGGHFVMLAGFDEASGMVIVNDPQSRKGPVPMPIDMIMKFHGSSQSAWAVTK